MKILKFLGLGKAENASDIGHDISVETDSGQSGFTDNQTNEQARQSEARGYLVFALDATSSRAPCWDETSKIQAEMFHHVASIGQLNAKLAYFRGGAAGGAVGKECQISRRWTNDPSELTRLMNKITCAVGYTQIERVIDRVLEEHKHTPVSAVIYIGDSVEEDEELLKVQAYYLADKGIPLFIFYDDYTHSSMKVVRNSKTERIFRNMAQISGGAYAKFSLDNMGLLTELLRSVAVFTVGGLAALEAYSATKEQEPQRPAEERRAAGLLLAQIRPQPTRR